MPQTVIHHQSFFNVALHTDSGFSFIGRLTRAAEVKGTEADIGFLTRDYVALMCSEVTQW